MKLISFLLIFIFAASAQATTITLKKDVRYSNVDILGGYTSNEIELGKGCVLTYWSESDRHLSAGTVLKGEMTRIEDRKTVKSKESDFSSTTTQFIFMSGDRANGVAGICMDMDKGHERRVISLKELMPLVKPYISVK